MIQEALTFADILLQPAYADFLPKDTQLQTQLTSRITLNIPIISAAMDTVTEKKMAISLAQQGGMGIIHKNMSPAQQADQIKEVKRFASHMVYNPITVEVSQPIEHVFQLKEKHSISSIPVLENGNLVGIITSRDLRMSTKTSPIGQIMTPKEKLITATPKHSRKDIITLMHQNRIEQIMITEHNKLVAIVALKDVEREKIYPNASVDQKGKLRVGAAAGVGDKEKTRITQLVEAGADLLAIDTAHGHSKGVIEQVKWIKQQPWDIDVIAGNIATEQAAQALIDAGADGVKVGIGPGSICTTRIVSGVGVPQITAILNVAKATAKTNVTLIADGGISHSGDIAKAIACGADSVMLGSLLAGTSEAPGDIEYFQGRAYKTYRGMGSIPAMKKNYGSSDRYFQDHNDADKLVPEGVEGRVFFKGELQQVISQLIGGLRASMGYTGCKTIDLLKTNTHMLKITSAGLKESHVHDVTITKESPNYQA